MENQKLKNKKIGRPPFILNKELFIKTLKRVKSGEISNIKAMEICNMRKTLYFKYKKQMDKEV